MKKKLILLALAAIPAVAFADVTIYGQLAGGVEYNKTGSSTVSPSPDGKLQGANQINDWTSRIGIRGYEGLGNGLKAIWQVETGLALNGDNQNDGSQTGKLASRETFVGLSGDSWGKVRLGKLKNYAYSDMQDIDPGHYSEGSVAGLGYFTRLNSSGVNNTIRYDSPDWAGFSLALLYGADQNRGYTSDNQRINNQTINLGLSYQNSGFFGKYSYQRWSDADKVLNQYHIPAPTDISVNKDWHLAELGYNANNIYAVLSYQQVRGYGVGSYYAFGNNPATNAVKNSIEPTQSNDLMKTREAAITLGYTFMGNLTPYLSFVKGWDVKYADKTLDNTGYKQYVLGLDYDVSKQTSLYGSLGQVNWSNSALDKESSFGVGVVHKF